MWFSILDSPRELRKKSWAFRARKDVSIVVFLNMKTKGSRNKSPITNRHRVIYYSTTITISTSEVDTKESRVCYHLKTQRAKGLMCEGKLVLNIVYIIFNHLDEQTYMRRYKNAMTRCYDKSNL